MQLCCLADENLVFWSTNDGEIFTNENTCLNPNANIDSEFGGYSVNADHFV